jgi:invasion protein IalB
MSSSIDRSNIFRALAGPAVFAAFVLLFGSAAAVAQDGQSVPKATAPQAAPAVPAGTAPAAGAAGEDSGWVKLCLKNEQTGRKQVCFVNYEALEPETSMVVGAVAVRTLEGDDKQYLIVRLTTAYSLVIKAGVQVRIDEGEAIPLRYAVCFPSSCEVQIELSKEMFEKMRNGQQMVVASMTDQQKARVFPVSLTGFSKSFDGPPVDNAQYEASRRAMMEKLRKRQLEIANQIGQMQKQMNAAAAGQAQADGTLAPAPDAGFMPQMAPATPQ